MKPLKSAVYYECATKFKVIGIFYAIQYSIVALITVLIGILMGNFEDGGTSCLEMNSLIFVGIFGILGFKEDFKMLLQNGFTRVYIFFATFCWFAFMSGFMALADTILGNVLHDLLPRYFSMYGSLYGYGHYLSNWAWLTLIYLSVCSLFYLAILIVNKLGKIYALYTAVIFGGILLLAVALFRYVLSARTIGRIVRFLMGAMGFASDGVIYYLNPLITFFILAACFSLIAYAIIRRTELK
ncbi:MAG TPA: hypothetical protein IAB53_05440 [Candidatus Scybalocola faecipullorum]|nr:hypothetical protein [Candidatus Scybalocola faecipullorum]